MATRNSGKLREFQELLTDLPFLVRSLTDFPSVHEVPETGQTFVENAVLKAIGYANQTGLLTLADDSGLEVDALDGAPGVFSARFLDETASYAARMTSLLAELSAVDESSRTARFVCVVAIVNAAGNLMNISTGTCEGRIASERRGSGGFGYDPIFVPNGYDLTFAELDMAVKNQISHRAQALQDATEYLQNLTSALHAD